MLQPPPAQPGMNEDDIDTPALVLDLDALEHNLDAMAALLEPTGVRLRAHAKAHKSPVIAHLQMARGAVGQCVQKVAEAEAFAWGGVPDILVSNQIVGTAKLARLAALSRIARVSLCADHPLQIEGIENAAAAAGVRLPVLVEMDVGGGRCGVEPGAAAALAQRVAHSRHLVFAGLQAYHGGAQHRREFSGRKAMADAATEMIANTTEDLTRRGLSCSTVTGSGTGTFALDAASGVYTEIQAGSYLFMDADYGRNLDAAGAPVSMFRNALFVLATVISAPERRRAVLDAGHKALPIETSLPWVWQRPGLHYVEASDEHGRLEIDPQHRPPFIGEKLRLVPGHCDPTVDRFDWYVGVRGGWVECLWPVAARGGMY